MRTQPSLTFTVEKKSRAGLARAAVLKTPHGVIETPSFVVVGTNATVKTLSPEEVLAVGGQVVLANTYHLYIEPGGDVVRRFGGLRKFMGWDGPTMTDSGGFQVFSLGAAYGKSLSKILRREEDQSRSARSGHETPLAKITEEGVEFRSHRDGSTHFMTPERSIEIQHAIGADMIFAFDECTSPDASHEYQKRAMERTHRWAKRSLAAHKNLAARAAQTPRLQTSQHTQVFKDVQRQQGLFGIVQGGPFEDLRKESAQVVGSMDFDGFGLGGSYYKADIDTAVAWITELLPENKPRHLLGIGEPEDMLAAIEQGVDLFDCVAPTRMARTGTLYTHEGRINILNSRFRRDFAPVDAECECSVCRSYTRAYISHLFRVKEVYGLRLASIHNLYFLIHMIRRARAAILDDVFYDYRREVCSRYYGTP